MAAFALALAFAAPATAATNNIFTVAGTGTQGFSGDGGPATAAGLTLPISVSAIPGGGYLIADQGTERVRRVAPDGTITTVAGNGTSTYGGDNGPATSASFSAVSDVAAAPDGSILIADGNNNRIRRVGTDGIITTVAGTGAGGFGGDGAAATAAQISFPADVAVAADGSYLIADNDTHRIRRVGTDGNISTVAGSASIGSAGDGGPATAASLNGPVGVAFTADGGFLIADADANRVRRVAPDGTISTVAGTGTAGFLGDGGPATAAQLNGPARVAVTPDGGFVIADRLNQRIRKVAADGTISTIAGDGTAGSGGDNGPATAAQFNSPFGVSVNQEGDILVADTSNFRIRSVDAGDPPPPTAPPAPPPPPAPPTPTLKRTVEIEKVSGKVTFTCPGSRSKTLTTDELVKLGCVVDSTNGRVAVTAAKDARGTLQRAVFSLGAFKVTQPTVKGKVLTELALSGPLPACPKAKRSTAQSAKARAKKKPVRRRLFGTGAGTFRTKGRYGTATVRGTNWTTEDRCDGTLVSVARGVVAVESFVLKRTVTVRAGRSYLAPSVRPKSKSRARTKASANS